MPSAGRLPTVMYGFVITCLPSFVTNRMVEETAEDVAALHCELPATAFASECRGSDDSI